VGRGPWSDPAVENGFAAAYAPLQERRHGAAEDAEPVDEAHAQGGVGVPTPQDQLDEQADVAARPLTRTGRRARAPRPGRLSPARAVAGAAVSVAGVLLGIGTLLWVSDDPSDGPGPVVQAPPPAAALGTQPESETAPVDPPPAPPLPVTSVAPAPAAPAPAQAAAAPAPPKPSLEVPVTVLNNSRIDGLADRAAARFRAGGWPVAKTGNFRGKIPSTTVYYERGQQASARAFAARFGGIVRVRPRFATLPARGLVVVVTRDYAAS
jgi:hypothetical protein